MNESRFNSKPNQALNHELDETAIKIPNKSDDPNIIRLGFEVKIKKRSRSSYTGYEPVSLSLAYLFLVYCTQSFDL